LKLRALLQKDVKRAEDQLMNKNNANKQEKPRAEEPQHKQA
jgi:hypothetical protein